MARQYEKADDILYMIIYLLGVIWLFAVVILETKMLSDMTSLMLSTRGTNKIKEQWGEFLEVLVPLSVPYLVIYTYITTYIQPQMVMDEVIHLFFMICIVGSELVAVKML